MAKDTRNIPSAGAAKAGLKKIAQRADEVIVEQSKDASNESIQAGNAERMEGLPSSASVTKDAPALPDPLRKPNIEPLDPTPGQDARAAAGNVGTGRVDKTTVLDFGRLPSRPEGGSTPAAVNVTDKPDVAVNLIDRMKSGMGLPGEEQGHLDRAISLHTRDREIAARTGKVVNGVQPNDPQATALSVFGGHHHRLAKVMHTFGIGDEEVYKSAAAQSGQRLETYVHGLHKIAQEHEDSKRQITHTPKEGAFWEHPTTKEVIPVAANHPDMPSAFTRTKGKVARVTRDASGKEVIQRAHEGWDPIKVAGGRTIYRQSAAPKGIDLVDHMRVQMLSEHGPSKTSRRKGADIATDIANAVSGVVPRGMMQIGKRKTAKGATLAEPVEGTEPLLVPKPPKVKVSGTNAPYPPGVRGLTSRGKNRESSAIADNQVLTGIKEPEELPTFISKGPKATQPVLPGTGVPKAVSSVTKPAVTAKFEGPLTHSQAADLDLSIPLPTPPKGSAAAQMTEQGEPPTYKPASYTARLEKERRERNMGLTEDQVRTKVVEPAEYSVSYIPTDRNWKPDSNRGQQFAIDTTDMTGAGEVAALSKAGSLVKSGKKAKKVKPMEQPSLFPDFEVKEGRSNAFYTAGAVQPVSERTKVLQGSADKPFGKQPNNKDFETEESADSVLDRLKVGPKKKAD
jgi:hypothetical protein